MTQSDGKIYHELGLKTNITKVTISIHGNLQIQCNTYQIMSGIFTELEQKVFKFV